MFKPKLKHVILVMCIAIMAFGVVAVAHAVRPANPKMDYVPQNLGIYDTYYCNFKESDCRSCHGTTTAWRHHDTQTALRGDCCFCHVLNPGGCENPIPPERDCKVCHIDGGPLGDIGNPHHKSRYADAGTCTACHSSLLVSDLNTQPVPQYDPTTITPTPYSCENCHWPNGAVAHSPAPLTDWNLWSGFPKPTTWPDSLPHPAPIEAQGPVLTGALWSGPVPPAKPFRPLDGTHHEINGLVYPNCYNCHGTNPDTDPSWDPNNPYLIRMCENCHDIYTLHDLGPSEEHTSNGIGGLGFGGYTRGGNFNTVVLQNEKCVACHMDNVPPDPMPVAPPAPAVIDYILPFTASPGAKVSIYALAPDSFGDLGPSDQVQMFNGAWVNMPVVSWTNNKIEFIVDGWTFTPNTWAGVRVAKAYWAENNAAPGGNNNSICDPGETCVQTFQVSNALAPGFFVRKHPVLTSLSPDSGTWGTGPGSTIITINGVAGSFFSQREGYGNLGGGLEPTIGYSTYVELVASNDRYRVTEMTSSGWAGDAALGAWSDTAIKIRLAKITVGGNIVGNLLDVNTNNAVPLADLYKGNWQLYVITDYFIDDGTIGGAAPNGVHMLKHAGGHLLGKLDNDTLIYREISDPLPFFATNTPFISSIGPTSLKGGNLAAVYGINFGTTQDTSTIFAQACSGVGPVFSLVVSQWANDRVIFRTPVIVPPQKTGCVKVRVPKVLPPGSIDSNFSPAITVTP